jgi:hydroxymethylglutaryl-CoA lyase
VERLYGAILGLGGDGVEFACHFHNTYGMALANCYAALRSGVRSFETSIAGLGGCPFTKIAGGNVCTEDLVHMLQRMSLRQDVRLDRLIATAQEVAAYFGRQMEGVIHRTGPVAHGGPA